MVAPITPDIPRKMNVLLTGAGGFVGRYVLDALVRRGIRVVCVGRGNVPAYADVRFLNMDLLESADMDALMEKAGATHLLHLAWYTRHGDYWTSSLNLRWVQATINLVDAFCRSGGQRVVVAGTCAEYDWSYGYCREDTTPLNPSTLYGIAKDAARRLVMAVCDRFHVPCAWGRLFIPYGKGEAPERLIPSLIRYFRGGQSAFGVHAGAYRDFMHVSDVAEALLILLHTDTNGAYNVGSGCPTQVAHIVRTLAELIGADPRGILGLSGERPNDPPLLVGDNTRLKALGWSPGVTLAEGLARSLS